MPALQTSDDMAKHFPQRKHLKRIPVWLPSDQVVTYFVTACTANARDLFTEDDVIRTAASSLLRIADRLGWEIHKVCFMPNHVHMLISPLEDREKNLSVFMQRWKSSVTQRFRTAGIEDKIWQSEFFDRLLRSDESAEQKWEYIEQNPVRAGLVRKTEEYVYCGSPEEIVARLGL
jgi:REP element-mobilizing transposase RayT